MPDPQPNPAEPSPFAPNPAPPDLPPPEAASTRQSDIPEPTPPETPIPEPAPMLDVHPAHHAASTWRDFFVHIATIVLGLIIAVGLEQTVEYLHHRNKAREARENINQEIALNLDILQDNQKELTVTQQQLTRNLDLLDSNAPDTQVLPQLGIDWTLTRRHDAAWNAAKIDGSLALIPPNQIGGATYFYETTDALGPILFGYFTDMDTAGTLIEHARVAGKLTPSQRQLLLSVTASAMGRSRTISRSFTSQIHALQRSNLQ